MSGEEGAGARPQSAKRQRSDVRGLTDKIKTACQLDDAGGENLRRTLDGLAHPAVD